MSYHRETLCHKCDNQTCSLCLGESTLSLSREEYSWVTHLTNLGLFQWSLAHLINLCFGLLSEPVVEHEL